MAKTEWYEAVEFLTPYIVRILTPQGSGTGFLVSCSKNTGLVGIATADHVISHAHYWQEPIRIEHQASGKSILLRHTDRAINSQPLTDTAGVVFERGELILPTDALQLTPPKQHFKAGVEIGWLGYPAIPQASLCFFTGHISAWIETEQAYLVDGVAINGVSGGPAFITDRMLVGVVSAYIPNRATGEPLPGLAVVRGVDQFHDLARSFRSLDDAKAQASPAIPPSTSPKDTESTSRQCR